MSKAEIAEKVKELINAPSCCAELKAVGKAWLDAVGTSAEKEMSEKLIAEAFTFTRALNKSGNINKFDGRGDNFFGFVHFRKNFKTLVGNRNDTDVRLNCCERIIRGERAGVG